MLRPPPAAPGVADDSVVADPAVSGERGLSVAEHGVLRCRDDVDVGVVFDAVAAFGLGARIFGRLVMLSAPAITQNQGMIKL